jgi:hypothetical protein
LQEWGGLQVNTPRQGGWNIETMGLPEVTREQIEHIARNWTEPTRICAWCNTILSVGGEAKSHTICIKCANNQLAQLGLPQLEAMEKAVQELEE